MSLRTALKRQPHITRSDAFARAGKASLLAFYPWISIHSMGLPTQRSPRATPSASSVGAVYATASHIRLRAIPQSERLLEVGSREVLSLFLWRGTGFRF
jgi:hypothetical protein